MSNGDTRAFIDSVSDSVGEMLAASDDGSKIKPVTCVIEFALEPGHLAAYAEAHGSLTTTVKTDEKDINVLRARHHGVARLLAMGLPEGIVAELTNFTAPYISTLKQSPSMAQLMAHYRSPANAAAEIMAERLRTAAGGALERLISKLEAGKLSSQEELALAKLGFDRSGHGPSQTHYVESEHTDTAEVMKLHAEAKRRDASRLTPVAEMRRLLPKPGEKPDAAAA